MSFARATGVLFAASFLLSTVVSAQVNASAPSLPDLTASQIVERIARHAQRQGEHLKPYAALRHYQAEYKGFVTTIVGKMDVEASYDAGSGKSFRIVSQSG